MRDAGVGSLIGLDGRSRSAFAATMRPTRVFLQTRLLEPILCAAHGRTVPFPLLGRKYASPVSLSTRDGRLPHPLRPTAALVVAVLRRDHVPVLVGHTVMYAVTKTPMT